MTQPLTLLEARKRRQMTQETLAERSGVDQTYISLLERALRTPSDDVKAKLAKALRIAPSKLRFAEPLPEASVAKSYDREGQSVIPTDRRQVPDRRSDADRRIEDERRAEADRRAVGEA